MTKIMLIHWLDFKDFTTQPSPNDGWVLFLPNKDSAPHKTCAVCGHTDAPDVLKCDECGHDMP